MSEVAIQRINKALSNGNMATWFIDLETNEISTSAGMKEIFGEEIENNVFDVISRRVHPDDRQELNRTWQKAVKDRTFYYNQYRIIRPDGEIRWILTTGSTDFDKDGKPVSFSGVNVDITERKMNEELIVSAHKELNDFFIQSHVPMAILHGYDYRFTLVNKAYEDFVGRHVLGKTVAESFTTEETAKFIPLLAEVYKTGIPFEGTELPFRILNKKGESENYLINIGYYPLRELSGEIKGIFAFVQDVTVNVRAREIIERSEVESKEISNSLPQIVFTARADGFIDWRNKRWDEYVGLDCSGNKNKIESLVHPDDVVATSRAWDDSIATGTDFQLECRLKRAYDQQYRWHLARAIPSRGADGKITKWIGTKTDIHDLKNIRQDLENTQSDLILAKNVAEIATQAKSAFLANMSHEIRTPLAAILGFSALLKESGLEPSERDQYIDTIVRNGHALTKIIDDILDLAKIEAGRIEVEQIAFSISALANESVELFRDKAKQKGIYLILDVDARVPAMIISDPTRVRQILINLIGNAIKFTDRGWVKVAVTSITDSAGQLQIVIDVKDSGIGLTQEQKTKLFEPFVQADDTTTRKFGGTGLGLVLSQKLSKALGGSITISEYALGNGCTFTVNFPAKISTITDVPVDEKDKLDKKKVLSLRGIKVLVVDDAEDNLFLVSILLKKNGAIIGTAPDGEIAVEMALAGSYDIILMDIQMPKMDGYQAMAALKSKGYQKPVIALTAHALSEDYFKSHRAGFVAHITKPLDDINLINTINKFAKYSD